MRLIVFASTLGVLLFGSVGAVRAVDCGDTVTASVTLDHDLVECDGPGLVVAADGVTIDLAGHTIDGDEGADSGIVTLVDRKNLTVKGPGVIRGFSGGIVVGGASLKVLNVTFTALTDTAINVGPCPNSLVAGNVFADVAGALDFAAGGGKVVVKDNVAARLAIGIVIGDAAGAVITNNVVADVRSASAIIVAGPGAVVTGNRVARAAEHGILANAVTNGKIVGNVVTATVGSGVVLGETQTTRVERNVVSAAGDFAIGIRDAVSDGNRFRRNRVLGGGAVGIFVPAGAGLNVIEGNVVEGTVLEGVRVEQAGTVLKKNRADANGAAGIVAVTGTIDGGGNRGRGNAGPVQCDGVFCP